MSRFEPKTFQFFLQRFANRLVARTGLSDVEVGGILHNFAMAFARECDDMSFQTVNLQRLWDIDTAAGEDLDKRGADCNPDEIERQGSTKATGQVEFSRSGAVGTISIPSGSIVRVPGGEPEFKTTAAGQILNGFTSSGNIAIEALEAGADGNADAATITQMDAITGVETVSNPAATTGGTDEESDAEYRSSIKSYIRSLGRGTKQALEWAVLDVSLSGYGRVVSAHCVEGIGSDLGKVWIYVDDGSGTIERTSDNYGSPETVIASASGGERRASLDYKPVVSGTVVSVWVNAVLQTEGTDFTLNYATGQITFDETVYPTGLTALDAVTAEYTYYVGLLAESQKVVDGDPGDYTAYPGYRAFGVQVFVVPPIVLQQVIVGSIVVEDGYDSATVIASVKAAINRYINGLGVNGDVILSELIFQAQSVPGVFDVNFTSPVGNVTIGEDEIPRVENDNIDLT
jgi:uncharacterized phage protein gp47/JayE